MPQNDDSAGTKTIVPGNKNHHKSKNHQNPNETPTKLQDNDRQTEMAIHIQTANTQIMLWIEDKAHQTDDTQTTDNIPHHTNDEKIQ